MCIKKRWQLLIWILVVALVVWAIQDIQWAAVWAPVSRLHPLWLGLLLLFNLFTMACFGLPWWLILRTLGQRVSLWALILHRIAGFGWSYFIPGPFIGGEPWQVLALRRRAVPMSVAVTSVALDRALEWLVNLGVMLAGLGILLQLVALPIAVRLAALVAVAAVLMALLLYIGAAFTGRRPLTRVLPHLPRLPAPWAHAVREAEARLAQAGLRSLAGPVLAVMVSWVLVLLDYWLLMAMLGLRLSLWRLLAVITVNRVAFLVPVPAGLGAVEGSQILVMHLLGLDVSIGLAHSLLSRLRDMITGALGLFISARLMR